MNLSGSVLIPFAPIVSERTGTAAATSRPQAIARLNAGRRSTRRTTALQKRPSGSARCPTRIAPAARLRMIVFGTISIPSIAITNALPLKSTARLAVAPAATIASDRQEHGHETGDERAEDEHQDDQ